MTLLQDIRALLARNGLPEDRAEAFLLPNMNVITRIAFPDSLRKRLWDELRVTISRA